MTDSLTDFDLARFEDLTADLDALRAAKLRAELKASVVLTALEKIKGNLGEPYARVIAMTAIQAAEAQP